MITKFFNGKYYFSNLFEKINFEIFFCNFFLSKTLCLSIFIIGNNFSSNLYIKNKIYYCNLAGISCLIIKFSCNIKINTIFFVLNIINLDILVNGIIIQLPIFKKLNLSKLFNSISVNKDIDLLTSQNFGNYIFGYSNFIIPSTVKSVLFLFKKLKIKCFGLRCAIFGFSNIIGKPLSFELNSLGMTVIIFSKYDTNFLNIIKTCDIIISAVGITNFLNTNDLSIGSFLIDVGINDNNYDFAFGDFFISINSSSINVITPVPGGIGPLTVYNILSNLIKISINKNFIDMI